MFLHSFIGNEAVAVVAGVNANETVRNKFPLGDVARQQARCVIKFHGEKHFLCMPTSSIHVEMLNGILLEHLPYLIYFSLVQAWQHECGGEKQMR